MFRRKRAMTPEAASTKKKTGHINERLFSELIDGYVIPGRGKTCLLYTSPSPRDRTRSRMPSSA